MNNTIDWIVLYPTNGNINYIADTICTYYGIHLYSTIHFVTHELFHLGEMAERTKAADC